MNTQRRTGRGAGGEYGVGLFKGDRGVLREGEGELVDGDVRGEEAFRGGENWGGSERTKQEGEGEGSRGGRFFHGGVLRVKFLLGF